MRVVIGMWLMFTMFAVHVRAEHLPDVPLLPEIRHVQQVRQLPAIDLGNGWSVRVGISFADEVGPWRFVYCLTQWTGDVDAEHPMHEQGPLGPLDLETQWDDEPAEEQKTLRHKVPGTAERLYGAIVVLYRRGACVVRVRKRDGTVLAARRIVVDEESPFNWHSFARPVLNEDDPKEPNAEVRPSAPPAYPLLRELPPAAQGPYAQRFRLMLDKMTLRVGTDEPTYELRADNLLARWWINGRAIPAPQPFDELRMADRMLDDPPRQIAIQFGFPEHLGPLRPGDVVGLQLMLAPDGTARPRSRGMLLGEVAVVRQQYIPRQVPPLMLSNRLDITVTEELLDAIERGSAGQPKMGEE